MYSYNNIVEKGEPPNKERIERALDGIVPEECPRTSPHNVAAGVDCLVVEDVLSAEACDALVDACQSVGFSFWKQRQHECPENSAVCEDTSARAVRIVDTIEANFPRLSDILSRRLAARVQLEPKIFSPDMPDAERLYAADLEGTWVPHALSENLLFGRYGPGGHFMPHIDGSTIVDLNTRSFYTLLLYLNDCPAGGETFLFAGDQSHVVRLDTTNHTYRGDAAQRVGAVHPRKGTAAFFYCDLLHEGAPVTEGIKYICRADLLYRREPPILTSDMDQRAFALYQEARLLESSGQATEACACFQRVRRLSPAVARLYQLD